jgi:hypothetical protein
MTSGILFDFHRRHCRPRNTAPPALTGTLAQYGHNLTSEAESRLDRFGGHESPELPRAHV